MKKNYRILSFILAGLVFLLSGCGPNELNPDLVKEYAKNSLGFTEVYAVYSADAKRSVDFVEYEGMKANSARTAFVYGKRNGQDTVYFFLKEQTANKDLGNVFIKSYAEMEQEVKAFFGEEQDYMMFLTFQANEANAYPLKIAFRKLPFNKDNDEIYFYAFTGDGVLKLYVADEFIKEC